MSLKSRILYSMAAMALLPLTPALAADYDPPIYVDPAPEYTPVEVGSGWYLRGDIGYSVRAQHNGTLDYRMFDTGTGAYTPDTYDTASLGNGFNWGGGIGYNFTDMIRADVTIDATRMSFDGTTSNAAPCRGLAAGFPATTCRTADSGSVDAYSFLANGYVDLGTYVGITPYLGAGAGMTYVDWDPITRNSYCVGATCPAALAGITTHPGEKSWRFTYAAMAGLSYDISPNMKIDLGYRFRHIAGGPMYSFDAASTTAGASGTQGNDSGFTSHEVRVGLRYELW